jgi:hypothetical protein
LNFLYFVHIPLFILPFLIFIIAFLLIFQSFWFHSFQTNALKEISLWAAIIAAGICELSFVLGIWPIGSTVYAVSLTSVFYVLVGLSQVWFDERLFRGVLWEYVWIGFISILLLLFFSG